MDNLNFNIEIFKDYRYNLTPEGNYLCPIHDCNSVLELANEQQFPNDNQIKMFWSHVQSAHSDEFENLLKQFSEKTYIPKESKVSIPFNFISFLVRAVYMKMAIKDNKLDRISDSINTSNGSITKILLKLMSNSINDQKFFQCISEEHHKLQQELKEILNSSTTPVQQQPTTLGSL
ncbi:unnamed protein product [Rotaria magnacalcarata]|uniref:Uncharacterized protein n=2 Tax=Rotaria magnacalcarata TaxID=392030 RepID=A0A816CML1_9BILA|nr:unnamed protein product [Rotaria magnacalcarata]CAF1624604.1 unnamed protein product [Rotaria magnacalcarata]